MDLTALLFFVEAVNLRSLRECLEGTRNLGSGDVAVSDSGERSWRTGDHGGTKVRVKEYFIQQFARLERSEPWKAVKKIVWR